VQVADVVPLGGNQVLLQRAAVFDKDFIEDPLVGDLRKAEHLATERGRFLGVVPGDDFRELVLVEIFDGELCL
jgi:hypothetical protein